MLKTLIVNSAKKLGYEIIPSWRKKKSALAELLWKIFETKSIDLVLDVGANKGQYGEFLRHHVGYKGKIISFEPIRNNFLSLSEKAKNDSSWSAFQLALGSQNVKQNINVMAGDVFSSFLEPLYSNVEEYRQFNSVESVEEVNVVTLDSIWDEIVAPLAGNVYLKVDTQGYDLEVITGSQNHLGSIRALQSELSVISIYTGMPTMTQSLSRFNALGFDLCGIFPVCYDSKMRIVELDAVMMNRNT